MGKNANRRLRAGGEVPAVVYGAGLGSVPIQVAERRVFDILRSGSGSNTVFLLQLHGTDQQRHAMIRELQTDALTGKLVHIDFQRIELDKKVQVEVPIELVGEAQGVKTEGGMLDFVTREVEVECLPNTIPPHLDLDVSALHVGQHVEAGQLQLPEGVELLTEPERVIVSIAARQAAEAEEGEGEEALLLEAKAEEPEVIHRGKAGEDASE
jgi:large subunit ribosomal protein L25